MERVDDLQLKGLRIVQDTDLFSFGIDAVLLADFVRASGRARIADLGTGTGILPLLLYGRGKGTHITGVELQPRAAELARRNVTDNGLEECIDIVEANLCGLRLPELFDVVVSNPPYMLKESGRVKDNPAMATARTELHCTVRDVFETAARLLKESGLFFMVHRPNRMADIFTAARATRLEPKRLRFVKPYRESPPNLLLLECRKGGGAFLKVEPDLVVYQEREVYTDEILEIYGMMKGAGRA